MLTRKPWKLDSVASKQDQLISREIKAAYSALQDFLLSSNPSTKERRLGFAEDNLLKNTKLNLKLETDGVSNRALVGHAYYGLAYISFLRDDLGIAARHLLQAFEVAPRLSREVLAPQLYEKLLLPQCRQLSGIALVVSLSVFMGSLGFESPFVL